MGDGAGPASPVLTDGTLQSAGSTVDGTGVYTQGLSQTVYSSSANTWSSTYAHSDALGSLRLTTDNTQSLSADRLVYDAFGNIVAKPANAPVSPLKFAGTSGYLLDSDSNLELCGSRYYNPATGRFMTSDPAGDGDNWYTYVGNNPLTATDPTGMFAVGSGGSDLGNPGGHLDMFLGMNASSGIDGGTTYFINGRAYFGTEIIDSQNKALTMPESMGFGETGWGDGIATGLDWAMGSHYTDIYYPQKSVPAQELLNSIEGLRMQLGANIDGYSVGSSGDSGHVHSYISWLLQPWNGTALQLGLFNWTVTARTKSTYTIEATNVLTMNSFFAINAFNLPFDLNKQSGMGHNVTQHFTYTLPIPKH